MDCSSKKLAKSFQHPIVQADTHFSQNMCMNILYGLQTVSFMNLGFTRKVQNSKNILLSLATEITMGQGLLMFMKTRLKFQMWIK